MIGIASAISIGLGRKGGGFVGLLDLFPGAAAAYSLRKLRAAYSGAAVRVRRSSDPIEQDIGFDDNGDLDTTALLAFVNDATPVLDDYSGAAAAYSLRKLRTAYTGSAINVRRSSDGNTQDIGFDANGDLDTAALLDFVGNNLCSNPNEWANGSSRNGWSELAGTVCTFVENVTDADGGTNATQITRTAIGNGSFRNTFEGFLQEGEQYTFSVYLRSTNSAQVVLDISDQTSSPITLDSTWTLYTHTITQDSTPANFADFTILSPTNGVVEVYNPMINHGATALPFENNSSAGAGFGYVVTWYDQTQNDPLNQNNATQATPASQPKIVSAGALVTENGKAAIDFDGVDDRLITSSFASTLAQPSTTFIVNNSPNNTSNNTLIDGIIGSNRHLLIANANNYTLNAGAFVNTGANSDAQSLLYTLWNGASSEFASDGGTPDIINIGTHGLTGLTIGTNFGSSNANDGNVQEIILYNSDQSGNRIGIEGNIGRYYNIDGYRDGHVVTWYDQSLSNDATQSAGANQPKIVSGGSLVTENGNVAIQFNGANELVASGFGGSSIQDSYFVMNYQNDSNAMWMYDLYTNNSSRYSPYVRSGESSSATSAYGTPSYYVNGLAVTITTRNQAYNELSNSKGQILRVDEGANTHAWQDISFGLWYSSYGFNGNSQEIIIFHSDQSGNRTSIETNINNFYAVYPDFSVSGLLHDYPNAAAAYSVRQLTIYNNGYKEKLIRVRRSSGGETDVFADDSYELSLNSRVSAGGTLGDWIGSDDGFVVTWYDQSTNGNDATQGTPDNQPKIVSGGVLVEDNGKAAIDFDGVGDWIDTGITNSQFSQVFVVKNTTGTGTAIAYSGAVSLQSLVYNTLDDDITFSGGSGLYTIDNLNVKGYLNGVDETGAAATFTQTFNRLYFGSVNGTSSFISGKIQEYIHFAYASDQSANRTAIESNINTFYSIYP